MASIRLFRPFAAAVATALALAGAPQPAGAQVGTADVVASCGTPNSTYVVSAQRPLTQDTTGHGCSNGVPVFGASPGQPGFANVVQTCGTPNSTSTAGKGPRPVTMDTTGTLC